MTRMVDRRATRLVRLRHARGVKALNAAFGWIDEAIVREPFVGRAKRRQQGKAARKARRVNR